MHLLGLLVGTLFLGVSALHVFWAFGGKLPFGTGIPEANGKPLFSPGRGLTLLVALVLLGFATVALLLGFGQNLPVGWHFWLRGAGYLMGTVLLLRAVGEFRYVGFFKRVRHTTFARYDTWLFSPFCLFCGSAFGLLAARLP